MKTSRFLHFQYKPSVSQTHLSLSAQSLSSHSRCIILICLHRMMSKTFKGANVFMSRNLVPPELFDALQDALKHNGAEVFLCCDPLRTGPNDFHVISSNDHEKFDDLQKRGCNLLGPQCVLSCANERRPLPKQGYTCCLAMDGVKVLASGFEMDEKVEIGKMVTAMGGVLHNKACSDVNFVIVKNVLAAKYKWALNVLKKPTVTLNWLHQCWKEHRVVPQESYRVLPFSGLTICVSRIPADERKEMEKVVIQNGGKYSAELTKKCTHLVCDAPEGDKYKVARRWGHIHIITRKWFDQSVARKVCLSEESYPVQGVSASSINGIRAQRNQGKGVGNSEYALSSAAEDSNLDSVRHAGMADPDLEATLSQNMSTKFSDTPVFVKEENVAPAKELKIGQNLDDCVADDSQNDDNDLYLSDCRIRLVGFNDSEMRKLVNMVRHGGGSRYMSFNEKLTHIVVGTLSEIEKKDVRALGALGVIHVVGPTWLEDCDREKKEVPVLQRHIAYDLLLPKGAAMGMAGMLQGKSVPVQSMLPNDHLRGSKDSGFGISVDKSNELNLNGDGSSNANVKSDKLSQFCTINNKEKDSQKTQHSCNGNHDMKSSSVFKGRVFRFATSFPHDRRAEIIQWVNQGGGAVVDEQTEENVHFTVQCHGFQRCQVDALRTTYVSSHWIRSCLEAGCLLDIGSHILYSPLLCRIPLPGFERFRFCVSQYDEKDRLLLRNLCFVLGAKFVEKLTKKVTHLLCKFTNGPKYEAACKWGIQSVRCEWIYECVKQNDIVAASPFCPEEVTSQDREAGLCTLSQYPTQATRIIFGDNASQVTSQSQDERNIKTQAIGRSDSIKIEARFPNSCSKRARFFVHDTNKGMISCALNQKDPACMMTSTSNNVIPNTGDISHALPDVAAAIEDLLEQTSKIQELKSPTIECDKNLFSPDCSIPGEDRSDSHSAFGLSRQWMKRVDRKEEICHPSKDVNASMYDGFSETQTESQVVGYEEDLSGRQMIIDRVRTRSSMT